MVYLLIVFGLWGLWIVIATFVTGPEWAFALVAMGLGTLVQGLREPNLWYLGIGLGGAVLFLTRLSDLLLVTSDWVRVAVLRNRR